MSGWPDAHRRHSTTILSYGPMALSPMCCSHSLSGSTFSSITPGVAGRLMVVPFSLWSPVLLNRWFWCNGATASGNVDVGVYTQDGVLLANAGSTAQAGTTAVQQVAASSPMLLVPDSYYLGISISSATATFQGGTSGFATIQEMGLAAQTASAGPPCPATFSLISLAGSSSPIPVFGFSERSLI